MLSNADYRSVRDDDWASCPCWLCAGSQDEDMDIHVSEGAAVTAGDDSLGPDTLDGIAAAAAPVPPSPNRPMTEDGLHARTHAPNDSPPPVAKAPRTASHSSGFMVLHFYV